MTQSSQTPVKIGYLITTERASLIYGEPRVLRRARKQALSTRAVQACPAVNDFEKRCLVVDMPYNLRLRCIRNGNEFALEAISPGTRLDEDLLRDHVMLMEPQFWRDPDKPVIQVKAPYLTVCDEQAYVTQTAPFLDYKADRWPGTVVAGRFRFDYWPRTLSWAFEWCDTSKDLVLKKGEPWFYLLFEHGDPDRDIQFVQAEDTAELKTYREALTDVVKFVSNPFSLKERALERRPATLLKEKTSHA